MKGKGMEYMSGYGNSSGYTPPKGPHTSKGVYSHNKNPLSAPRKGSDIGFSSMYGNNSDVQKVQSMIRAQARNESLRGQSGC